MILPIISIVLLICVPFFCLRLTGKIFKIHLSFLKSIIITIIMSLLLPIWYFVPAWIIWSLLLCLISIIIFYLVIHAVTSIKFRKALIVYLVNGFFIVIFFILIIILFRFMTDNPFYTWARLYTVVGSAMSPELSENDMVAITHITNTTHFKRGDIIVFLPVWEEIFSIKRIVWLPWETVRINNNHVEVCTGQIPNLQCIFLAESYLSWVNTQATCGITEFKLDDTWFFVLWDNRWFSTDSRCCFSWECNDKLSYQVPLQNIKWKVFLRLLSKVKFY